MSRRAPFVERVGDRIVVEEPGRVSPRARRWVLEGPLRSLFRFLFRPSFHGWEHLPEGPVLMVCNHSGGGGIEVLGLAMMWNERFGDTRPVTGMAHPMAWYLPGPDMTVKAFGAVPSTYAHGERALAQGVPTIIFPGGDHDAFRPFWQAKVVDFNGRKGFLKLARRAWVPIVPMGIYGSHFTAPMLWRSKLLAWLLLVPRAMGLKRFPVTLLGVLGVILILWLMGPTVGWGWAALTSALWCITPIAIFIPILPWRIRVCMGPAITPEQLFGDRDEDMPLDDAYVRVVSEIRRLVHEAADR